MSGAARPGAGRLLLALLALLLAALPLARPAAAQSLGGLQTGSDDPLEIFADQGIEWQRDARKYIARGNAIARQGDTQVSADVLTAFYRDRDSQDAGGEQEDGDNTQAGGTQAGGGDIYRILAEGDVVVAGPQQTAYSDRAVYFVDEGIAVMRGADLKFVTPNETITARDSLEYWEEYQGTPIAVARGEATVVTPERRLDADELVATMRPGEDGDNEIVQVDAFGDVEISSAGEYARGDRAVYYVKEEVAILAGNVRITQGETQLNGQRAEVNLATGVSRLLPTTGGRVQGILAPREEGQPPPDSVLPIRPGAAAEGQEEQPGAGADQGAVEGGAAQGRTGGQTGGETGGEAEDSEQ
jgi:lipopolysaccharide export system protein LptA